MQKEAVEHKIINLATPPVTLYIMWHPDYQNGAELAAEIYKQFSCNTEKQLLDRRLGIPIFYRTEIGEVHKPTEWTETNRRGTAVLVVLLDRNMKRDPRWNDYMSILTEAVCSSEEPIKIIPISIVKKADGFGGDFADLQMLSITDAEEDLSGQKERLIEGLLHELCCILWISGRPHKEKIKIFISHAKKDGEKVAENIRNYIRDKTSLDSFFDRNDIRSGENFKRVIDKNIQDSVLLVLQTDAYASREWCRDEVLRAKQHKVPIIVVNMIQKGEQRSFPYLGNTPLVRWEEGADLEEQMKKIMHIILSEALRRLYFEQYFVDIKSSDSRIHVLSNPPELFDYAQIREESSDNKEEAEDSCLILYPDPPLGTEEVLVLKNMKPNYSVLTPVMLPLGSNQGNMSPLFSSWNIGVSIADAEELDISCIGEEHVRDVFIEFARFLLVNGASVTYGGDLRRGGYTEILGNLVKTYSYNWGRKVHKVNIYLTSKLPEDQEGEIEEVAKIHYIEHEATVPFADDIQERYHKACTLTRMREKMLTDVQAQIFFRGKTKGYSGKYPGLMEEAYLAFEKEKPVFLIGGLGGCTGAIARALLGQHSPVFDDEYHDNHRPGYAELLACYDSSSRISYPELYAYFQEKGLAGLHNGLTEDENIRLFQTLHIPEMISLVLTGLNRLEKGGIYE